MYNKNKNKTRGGKGILLHFHGNTCLWSAGLTSGPSVWKSPGEPTNQLSHGGSDQTGRKTRKRSSRANSSRTKVRTHRPPSSQASGPGAPLLRPDDIIVIIIRRGEPLGQCQSSPEPRNLYPSLHSTRTCNLAESFKHTVCASAGLSPRSRSLCWTWTIRGGNRRCNIREGGGEEGSSFKSHEGW